MLCINDVMCTMNAVCWLGLINFHVLYLHRRQKYKPLLFLNYIFLIPSTYLIFKYMPYDKQENTTIIPLWWNYYFKEHTVQFVLESITQDWFNW